jgi:hypothetical protein
MGKYLSPSSNMVAPKGPRLGCAALPTTIVHAHTDPRCLAFRFAPPHALKEKLRRSVLQLRFLEGPDNSWVQGRPYSF